MVAIWKVLRTQRVGVFVDLFDPIHFGGVGGADRVFRAGGAQPCGTCLIDYALTGL